MNTLIYILCYGLLLWLGLYIMQRDIKNPRILLTGLSLVILSICFGIETLSPYVSTQPRLFLTALRDVCFYLSIMLLSGALLFDLSDPTNKNFRFIKIWCYILLPAFALASIVFFLLLNSSSFHLYSRLLLAFCIITFLAILIFPFRSELTKFDSKLTKILLLIPLLVYIGSLMYQLLIFDHPFFNIFLLNGIALFWMAIVIFALEINKQGEVWLPDLFRSFDYTLLITLVFTGQVVLVISMISSFHFTAILLLIISITISILSQVFIRQIQTLFDHVAFLTFPKLRHERSHLRATEEIKLIVDDEARPELMDDEHFIRFTRRAFSHFGDLQRLSSNPLTQLRLIDQRLDKRGASQDIMARANELKSILLECIQQLKPQQDQSFGTTDEWRFYNALYYPYVIGIKPYSKRYVEHKLNEDEQEALQWFRTTVPERTFYNWTHTASRLVANHLKEKSEL